MITTEKSKAIDPVAVDTSAGNIASMQPAPMGFVTLAQSIIEYRIDGRAPDIILGSGGYNPWNQGEVPFIVPVSNIPDDMRHESELPISQLIAGSRGKIDARGDDVHPLYKRIPSNPGANMGILCTALNPYGSLSAIGKADKTYIALIASKRGMPITSFYQDLDMLERKIVALEGEKRSAPKPANQVVVSFDRHGNNIYRVNVPDALVKLGAKFDSLAVHAVESKSDIQIGLWAFGDSVCFKMLLDPKTKSVVGKIKYGANSMKKPGASGFDANDYTLYDTHGQAITDKALAQFEVSAVPIWVNEPVVKPMTRENVATVLGLSSPVTEAQLNDLRAHITSSIADRSRHTTKEPSFEFEFSDMRQGIADIIGFAQISIQSGTHYTVSRYVPNPYFDSKKHAVVVTDAHGSVLLNAIRRCSIGKPVAIALDDPRSNLVTPLNRAICTRFCSPHRIDMESVVRDPIEIKKKLQLMERELKTADLTKIAGTAALSGDELKLIKPTEA